jgi:hypothetical protein
MTLQMVLHIAAGVVAMAAGYVALFARKSAGGWHVRAGQVFVAAMVAMACLGAMIAFMKPDRPTGIIGLLTAYLVLSGWMTVRRPAGETGAFERWAFIGALALIGSVIAIIVLRKTQPYPAFVPGMFGAIGAIAAWGDFKTLRAGGVTGPRRINRHLWRMCAGMLIAVMSFFLGQQDEMPQQIRGSLLLWSPILTVIGVWVWQANRIRIRRLAASRRRAPA